MFWRKEKKEEIKKEVYYIPFDCGNCHAKDMVIEIAKGKRISEVPIDRILKCGKCGCNTLFIDGIKKEKEKK